MNFRLKDRTLLNGDIISPEIPYAEFSPEITETAIHEMVSAMNSGHEMLMLYKELRNNMHILNVCRFLERMDVVYAKYERELFEIRRM